MEETFNTSEGFIKDRETCDEPVLKFWKRLF